jgi:hypothetical protein
MSSRIPDTHAEAWALLPWLANGRIAPEDREWVENHVSSCAECRAELTAQRMIATQVQRDGVASPAPAASDEQRSFNKLWARVEASEAATPAVGAHGAAGPARSSRTVRWLAAAVIVQAIGLAALGSWVLERNRLAGNAVYRTLSAPAVDAPEATIRFVPSPELSVGQLQRLLADNGLRVATANEGGTIFALAPTTLAHPTTGEVVARLRATAGVLLAEPIARDADAR